MGFPFLSDEWVEATEAIRAKYEGRTPKIAQSIRINLVITDVPFKTAGINGFIDTSSGDLVLSLGELDKPDATITTDYEISRKMFVEQDQAAAMQAFMGGKIKIQGDLMKMMALQTAIPQDDVTREVAGEIKAITD